MSLERREGCYLDCITCAKMNPFKRMVCDAETQNIPFLALSSKRGMESQPGHSTRSPKTYISFSEEKL